MEREDIPDMSCSLSVQLSMLSIEFTNNSDTLADIFGKDQCNETECKVRVKYYFISLKVTLAAACGEFVSVSKNQRSHSTFALFRYIACDFSLRLFSSNSATFPYTLDILALSLGMNCQWRSVSCLPKSV